MLDKLLDIFMPSRQSQKKLLRHNARLESFMRAVPLEYCGWDQDGTQALSDGFCDLFGLDHVDTLADILQILSAGDARTLENLMDKLRQKGTPFDIIVDPLHCEKSLRVFGQKGLLADQPQAFSVLWVLDITDYADANRQQQNILSQLQEKETMLQSLFNAMPFPVWTRNEKMDIVWCNKTYAHLADASMATVIAEQKELPTKAASKAATNIRVMAQRALIQAKPQSARAHMVIDGARRLVNITEIPLSANQNTVGLAQDVTQEEELDAAYKRLLTSQREMLEQLRTAIAMFDEKTCLEFYNASYEQLTGLSGSWLDSRPRLSDMIDRMREARRLPEQADYKQFKQAWINRFTSLIDPHEEMLYLPDGTVLRMITIPRPTGGLMFLLEDVTSHLQLETSYNTLMAVQQETLENLAEGIAVFGEDGKLRLYNKAYAGIWGLTKVFLDQSPHIAHIAEKLETFFDPDAWFDVRELVMAGALQRAPRKDRLHCADGRVLEYAIMPLPDGNILNAWFDITDTVMVEKALIEKNAALEEAERLKSDFLANVSYQLRTPLNAMLGFAEMLEQQYFGPLNDRQYDYTINMISAGKRLVSLINDILDLSTIEAGYMTLDVSKVNLKDLIGSVVDLTKDWMRKQKLNTVVHCPDEHLSIHADEARIKQVLLNLISNAINHSVEGGTLKITAQQEDRSAVLTVEDTGAGIAQEDLKRVFTPFEKIRSGTAQRRGGAGLGLALVQKIIHLHDGTVSLESVEDEGTTVIVRLPLAL